MAAHILPFIKAVAPYIAQVATAAIPAFTSKPAEEAKADPVVTKQIAELQEAVTQNARSVHTLAEKLQQVIEGLESTAKEAKSQAAAYKAALYLSLGLSVTSVGICLYLLLRG